MFANIARVAKDKNTRYGFLLAFLVSGAGLASILLKADLGSVSAPLHYNIYFGIDLAGPGIYILLPWALTVFTVFVNFFLALMFIERELVASRLLAWFSSILSLVVFGALILVLLYKP